MDNSIARQVSFFNPARSLEARLLLGNAAPDSELFSRAASAAAFLFEHPEQRARWLGRFRRAACNPWVASAWLLVEPILRGRA